MRCIFEYVFYSICSSVFDFSDFFTNGKHGITEFIQLCFGFGFGRLNHQGTCHWEGNSRCVETIIHQALGDIFYLHSYFFEGTAIHDHFVRRSPL